MIGLTSCTFQNNICSPRKNERICIAFSIGSDQFLRGLDVHELNYRFILKVVSCHSASKVDIAELVASSSSLFEEIIYNEREMKSVMLVYFKYVTILVLHDVIDIVLLLEGKPMGAVSAFTCRNLSF